MPVYDPALGAFRPGQPRQRERSAGAAAGELTLRACLAGGSAAGLRPRLVAAGHHAGPAPPAPDCADDPVGEVLDLWAVPARGKAFVDLQNDVTAADVALARRES